MDICEPRFVAVPPRKATFSDGIALANDGCRLSYHLSGDPAAQDKVPSFHSSVNLTSRLLGHE